MIVWSWTGKWVGGWVIESGMVSLTSFVYWLCRVNPGAKDDDSGGFFNFLPQWMVGGVKGDARRDDEMHYDKFAYEAPMDKVAVREGAPTTAPTPAPSPGDGTLDT